MRDPTTKPYLPFGKVTASHVQDAAWLRAHLERRRRVSDLGYVILGAAAIIVGSLAAIGHFLDVTDVLRWWWGTK